MCPSGVVCADGVRIGPVVQGACSSSGRFSTGLAVCVLRRKPRAYKRIGRRTTSPITLIITQLIPIRCMEVLITIFLKIIVGKQTYIPNTHRKTNLDKRSDNIGNSMTNPIKVLDFIVVVFK
jgi:hypothetical protein